MSGTQQKPSVWDDFLLRHKRQNFTPAFNAYLESQIGNLKLPVEVRVDAWLLRQAWGNHSDSPVNAEGIRQVQTDCARDLKLVDKKGKPDRRKVNPVFQMYEKGNYIRFEGQTIILIDDPDGLVFAKSSPSGDPLPTNSEEGANKYRYFLEHIWGTTHPAEFQELQALERRHNEIRIGILTEWQAYKQMSERVGQTGAIESPKGADSASGRVRQPDGEGPTIDRSILITENGKQKTSSSDAQRPTTEATTTGAKPSLKRVAEALREFGKPDQDAVVQLIRSCRREAPDCTEEEIIHFVQAKGRLLKNGSIQNPIGFLLTSVPKCFAGESFHEFRKEREHGEAAAPPAFNPTAEQRIEELEEWIREHSNHPQLKERHAALDVLRRQQRDAAKAQTAGQR